MSSPGSSSQFNPSQPAIPSSSLGSIQHAPFDWSPNYTPRDQPSQRMATLEEPYHAPNETFDAVTFDHAMGAMGETAKMSQVSDLNKTQGVGGDDYNFGQSHDDFYPGGYADPEAIPDPDNPNEIRINIESLYKSPQTNQDPEQSKNQHPRSLDLLSGYDGGSYDGSLSAYGLGTNRDEDDGASIGTQHEHEPLQQINWETQSYLQQLDDDDRQQKIARQKKLFIIALIKSLIKYGCLTHRAEFLAHSVSVALSVRCSVMIFPNMMIISFTDRLLDPTTSQTIAQQLSGGLDTYKLQEVESLVASITRLRKRRGTRDSVPPTQSMWNRFRGWWGAGDDGAGAPIQDLPAEQQDQIDAQHQSDEKNTTQQQPPPKRKLSRSNLMTDQQYKTIQPQYNYYNTISGKYQRDQRYCDGDARGDGPPPIERNQSSLGGQVTPSSLLPHPHLQQDSPFEGRSSLSASLIHPTDHKYSTPEEPEPTGDHALVPRPGSNTPSYGSSLPPRHHKKKRKKKNIDPFYQSYLADTTTMTRQRQGSLSKTDSTSNSATPTGMGPQQTPCTPMTPSLSRVLSAGEEEYNTHYDDRHRAHPHELFPTHHHHHQLSPQHHIYQRRHSVDESQLHSLNSLSRHNSQNSSTHLNQQDKYQSPNDSISKRTSPSLELSPASLSSYDSLHGEVHPPQSKQGPLPPPPELPDLPGSNLDRSSSPPSPSGNSQPALNPSDALPTSTSNTVIVNTSTGLPVTSPDSSRLTITTTHSSQGGSTMPLQILTQHSSLGSIPTQPLIQPAFAISPATPIPPIGGLPHQPPGLSTIPGPTPTPAPAPMPFVPLVPPLMHPMAVPIGSLAPQPAGGLGSTPVLTQDDLKKNQDGLGITAASSHLVPLSPQQTSTLPNQLPPLSPELGVSSQGDLLAHLDNMQRQLSALHTEVNTVNMLSGVSASLPHPTIPESTGNESGDSNPGNEDVVQLGMPFAPANPSTASDIVTMPTASTSFPQRANPSPLSPQFSGLLAGADSFALSSLNPPEQNPIKISLDSLPPLPLTQGTPAVFQPLPTTTPLAPTMGSTMPPILPGPSSTMMPILPPGGTPFPQPLLLPTSSLPPMVMVQPSLISLGQQQPTLHAEYLTTHLTSHTIPETLGIQSSPRQAPQLQPLHQQPPNAQESHMSSGSLSPAPSQSSVLHSIFDPLNGAEKGDAAGERGTSANISTNHTAGSPMLTSEEQQGSYIPLNVLTKSQPATKTTGSSPPNINSELMNEHDVITTLDLPKESFDDHDVNSSYYADTIDGDRVVVNDYPDLLHSTDLPIDIAEEMHGFETLYQPDNQSIYSYYNTLNTLQGATDNLAKQIRRHRKQQQLARLKAKREIEDAIIRNTKKRTRWDLFKTFTRPTYNFDVNNPFDMRTALQDIILQEPLYPDWFQAITIVIMGASSANLFFQGGSQDMLYAGILSLPVAILSYLSCFIKMVGPLTNIVSAILVGFGAAVFRTYLYANLCMYPVMLAALLWLLPGLSITNSIVELSAKSIVSGTVRLVSAFFNTLQLGFGLAIGTRLMAWRELDTLAECRNDMASIWIILLFPLCSIPMNILLGAHPRQWIGMSLGSLIAFFGPYFLKPIIPPDLIVLGTAFVGSIFCSLFSLLTGEQPISYLLATIIFLVPGSTSVKGIASMFNNDSNSSNFFIVVLSTTVSIAIGLLVAKFIFPQPPSQSVGILATLNYGFRAVVNAIPRPRRGGQRKINYMVEKERARLRKAGMGEQDIEESIKVLREQLAKKYGSDGSPGTGDDGKANAGDSSKPDAQQENVITQQTSIIVPAGVPLIAPVVTTTAGVPTLVPANTLALAPVAQPIVYSTPAVAATPTVPAVHSIGVTGQHTYLNPTYGYSVDNTQFQLLQQQQQQQQQAYNQQVMLEYQRQHLLSQQSIQQAQLKHLEIQHEQLKQQEQQLSTAECTPTSERNNDGNKQVLSLGSTTRSTNNDHSSRGIATHPHPHPIPEMNLAHPAGGRHNSITNHTRFVKDSTGPTSSQAPPTTNGASTSLKRHGSHHSHRSGHVPHAAFGGNNYANGPPPSSTQSNTSLLPPHQQQPQRSINRPTQPQHQPPYRPVGSSHSGGPLSSYAPSYAASYAPSVRSNVTAGRQATHVPHINDLAALQQALLIAPSQQRALFYSFLEDNANESGRLTGKGDDDDDDNMDDFNEEGFNLAM